MPILNCPIPRSLEIALANQALRTGQSVSQIVSSTLAHCLNVPLHTLFQVSTSGALVEGVYEGAVSAGILKQHGNFNRLLAKATQFPAHPSEGARVPTTP